MFIVIIFYLFLNLRLFTVELTHFIFFYILFYIELESA